MILDRFRLDDRVAVVTGAGRGLGAAIAIAFAEAGADVVVSARTATDLEAVASHVAALGRRAFVVCADLTDLTAVAGLASTAVAQFGRLDVVVNNVGGAMPRSLLDTSPGFLERAFHFNVSTAHALTSAAAPLMGDGGSIVNITSTMGRLPGRGYAAYGTVKAALAHYSRIAARDLAPRIRVNALAVGSAETSAFDSVLDASMRLRMSSAVPLGRIADPSEIAAAALFLASPASSYVTGKVLEVDGGLERSALEQDFTGAAEG